MKNFFNYISTFEQQNAKFEISYNSTDPLNIITNFKFKVNDASILLKDFDPKFLEIKELKMYIDRTQIKAIEEISDTIDDNDIDYGITFIFTQSIEITSDNMNIVFYNDQGIFYFIENLSKKCCVKDISLIKSKINLICTKSLINNFESTLFQLNGKEVTLIDDETLNYISSLFKKDISIFCIPKSIPKSLIDCIETYCILSGQLSLLSNNYYDSKFNFIGKSTFTLIIDESPVKDLINQLEETIIYIFEDPKTIDQKLTFYRKVLVEKLTKDTSRNINNLEDNYFEAMLNELHLIFDAFQDGEISIFLKEKREIIKEYISVSKETLHSVNHLKNTLLRNLITIVVLFISNMTLKSKGIIEQFDYRIILIAVLTFITILIILHFLNDRPLKKSIENRLDIFNNHFKFISSQSKEIKNNFEISVQNELQVFQRLLNFSLIIYSIAVIIIIFLFVYSFPIVKITFIITLYILKYI